MHPSTYTLTSDNNKKTFYFDYSFSYITIYRIEAPKLICKAPDDWYNELSNLTLLFTYLDKNSKKTTFPLDLASQVKLTQRNPIIELNEFIIPEENRGNMTALGNYVIELTIELQCRSKISNDSDVKIYYYKTPGVRD